MATITNTVQGLNETVGLLKQILKAVGDDKKGATDVKDVANASNVLSGIDEKGAKNIGVIISSLEPLEKMKDDIADKIKNLAEGIKILSSKEVIDGLKKYNGISGKIGANIATIFISIGNAFDKIDGGLNLAKIKRFAMVLNSLTKALNRGVNVLYKIAGFVLVCAAVGLLAVYAWKQILLGFVTITAIALGIVAISYLLSVISKKSPNIYKAVSEVVMAVMSLALVVAICVVVGLVAIFAWEQILLGFVTITAIAAGIVLLSYIISLTAQLSEPTTKSVVFVIAIAMALALFVMVTALVGVVAVNAWQYILWGFAAITGIAVGLVIVLGIMSWVAKIDKIGSFKDVLGTMVGADRLMPQSVKDLLLIVAAIGLFPLACVAVGYVVLNNMEYILAGFAAISVIMLALVGILRFMGNAAKQSLRVQVSVKSLIVTIAAIVGVVYSIIKLAQMLQENSIPTGQVILVTVMMGLMMLGINTLLKTLEKIKVNPKGIITVLAISAVIGVMIFMLSYMADTIKKVQEVGGWGQIFIALASMVGVIVSMMAFAAVIGTLVSITIFGVPIVAILLGVGLATISAIAITTLAVGAAIKKIAEAVKDCKDAGIELSQLGSIGESMGNGLVKFATNIINALGELSLWSVIKVGIMMKPISNMVNVCSKFLKMISSFSTEDCTADELRPVFYNEETGEFNVAPKINVPNIGTAIARGFANFAKGIITGLEDLSLWSSYKVGIMMKPISKIINTCSKFLKMISGFTTSGNEESRSEDKFLITPVYYNESNGTFNVGHPIDVVSIGKTIANAFSSFVSGVVKGMEGVDFDDMDFSGLPDLVSSVTNFIQMISDITGSGDGKTLNMLMRDGSGNYIKRNNKYSIKRVNVEDSGRIIARAFISFIDILDKETRNGTTIYSKFKYWNENGVGTVIELVQKYLGVISDMYVTKGGFLAVFLKDSNGNYIKNRNGKYEVKLLNTNITATNIAKAFISFIDTLDKETRNGTNIYSKFKCWEENGVGTVIDMMQKFLLLMSSFDDGGNGTISVFLKDNNGNYMFDSRGNIRKRNFNYNTASFNVVKAFNTFLGKITDSIGISEDVDIKTFADSFEKITNSFDSITRVISEISSSTADKMKKNTDAINNFAESVGNLTSALEELRGVGDVNVNVKTRTNGTPDENGNMLNNEVDRVTTPTSSFLGGSNSETIKEGIIAAFKAIHFEIAMETDGKSGEILPVKRESGNKNSFNSYKWE